MTQIANANTITAISMTGIAIGIVVLALTYYHPLTKKSKIIRRILVRAKMRQAEVNSNDEIRRDYFLERIICNMSIVIKDLVILENLLRNYIDNCQPQNWQNVRHIADRSSKEIEKLEQKVILDFAQIVDLIHSKELLDRCRTNNLHYSRYLSHEILRINRKYDEQFLRELRSALREHIVELDDILALLEREREN